MLSSPSTLLPSLLTPLSPPPCTAQICQFSMKHSLRLSPPLSAGLCPPQLSHPALSCWHHLLLISGTSVSFSLLCSTAHSVLNGGLSNTRHFMPFPTQQSTETPHPVGEKGTPCTESPLGTPTAPGWHASSVTRNTRLWLADPPCGSPIAAGCLSGCSPSPGPPASSSSSFFFPQNHLKTKSPLW